MRLAETENKCPLCNTVVYHPDFKQPEVPKNYPDDKIPKSNSVAKASSGVIVFLFLVPLLISFISDLQADGKLDWFGFVAGALVVGYITLALPLWFKKPNPAVFVPCSFAASALYLLYINLATNGSWYLSFALPIISVLCLITCTLFSLIYYVKRGRLYIFGGALILLGGFMLLVEYLLNVTFGVPFVGWSIYPLVVLTLLGCMLIYLAIDKNAREIIKRKLFF